MMLYAQDMLCIKEFKLCPANKILCHLHKISYCAHEIICQSKKHSFPEKKFACPKLDRTYVLSLK